MMNPYRSLPSVDRLLAAPEVRAIGALPPALVTELARDAIAAARASLASGGGATDMQALVARVVRSARELTQPSLRPAINATGVIIHTNLGRAPLSRDARTAMEAVSRGYSNLEFDLEEGERGSRYAHLEALLQRVTGAEAGIAVNNNASALLLALSALAQGRDVVISRSQAIEIGGGFRIPDVMRQSGAHLIEVGTTNRTYVRDFADAIGPDTAALLRVHSSNFRIIGFTAFPELADLADLARARGVLLIDDLGSGCLLPTEPFGLAHEPTVQESVQDGADLSLFSGDKLLGGPQAGVIVGRRELIQRLRAHPLARAVRMDKASIAGLSATLLHYLRGEALNQIPIWRMIAAPLEEMERRASLLAREIGDAATTAAGRSMVGGGSLPEESLPTQLVALASDSPAALARRLRRGTPAVIGRTEHNRLLLDPRTIDPDDDSVLSAAVRAAIAPEL